MNETITRAAGASHGQETDPLRMEAMIEACDREPRQRTTLYGDVGEERRRAGRAASELIPVVNTPARRYERKERRPLARPGLEAPIRAEQTPEFVDCVHV